MLIYIGISIIFASKFVVLCQPKKNCLKNFSLSLNAELGYLPMSSFFMLNQVLLYLINEVYDHIADDHGHQFKG